MKTQVTGLILSLFFTLYIHAQTRTPINSGEVIAQGIKLHNDGKYKEAITVYQQVPRNDTNYTRMLYELAYSQSMDSNFSAALETLKKGLEIEENGYELEMSTLQASIVDDQGDANKALELYDSTLKKYPNAQNLLLNRAVTLMRLSRIPEAEAALQDLLLRNPYYASAHFRLGQVALSQGKMVPAMMCLYTYLINSPGGNYSNAAVRILGNISKQSGDVSEIMAKRTSQPEGNFALLEQIIQSKIALDKNYKVLTDLDDPIIRQLQVLMEKLEYDSENADFYMQFYVPYLKDIFEAKLFEPAVFYAFSKVDVDAIKRYVKKNEKEMNQALKAIDANLAKIRTTRELNYSRREKMQPIYHYGDAGLIGKGTVEKDQAVGPWEFYFRNGNVKSAGTFNSEGGKEGKWVYYFENGRLNGVDNWKNGKQEGEDLTYNKRGVLINRSYFKNGQLNGEKTLYYEIGHPSSVTTYADGKENGKYTSYYPSGQLKTEVYTKNDELDGLYRSYHNNGQLEVEVLYKEGKPSGSYKTYYDNGQLEFETTYVDGKQHGAALGYNRNGKPSRKANYINGEIDGEEILYNDEGRMIQKDNYKKNILEGLSQFFDDNGKLLATFLYENNKLKAVKYFDKEGKEISSAARKGKTIEVVFFNDELFKASAATFNDQNLKTGSNPYFYNSGKLKEDNTYKDGQLNGVTTGYYPDGTKSYETSYLDGEKHGPFRNYYLNGQVSSEGWYQEGKLNGDYFEYNEKGFLTLAGTYLNDDLYALRSIYYPDGKLDHEEEYYSGWLVGVNQYDTNGKQIKSIKIPNGTGIYQGTYPNGKTRFEVNMVNGFYNGTFTSYFWDGTVYNKKNYKKGLLDGNFTEYHFGNKIATQGTYSLGKKSGTWKYYDEEGKLTREEKYEDGELNGKSLYYWPNGKVEREINYKDGSREGLYSRFAYDGQLMSLFQYKDDIITSYSYLDKDGKEVAPIPVKGGIGKVVTYYRNGNKSSEMEFSDGKLTGAYTLYHPNGKIYIQEEKLLFGTTNGKLREYYPDGSPKTEYQYYLDNADGPYKEFYENGKLKEEGTLFNGSLHGTQKLYDTNGKLVEKRDYFFGNLLNITK